MTEYRLQYHNYGKFGLPLGDDASTFFGEKVTGIDTSLKFVKDDIGCQVFMIVGIGRKPPTFYLWKTFVIEEIEEQGGNYIASGNGWMLNPPQLLEGDEFDAFRKECANFAAYKRISHIPYTEHLRELSDKYHRYEWDDETIQFCVSLFDLIPDDPDAAELVNIVGRYLGYDQDVSEEEEELGEPKSEEQAVRWNFAFIKARRGQHEFRQSLLKEYRGQCAITGCDAHEALEASHIVPFNGDATNVLENGLLLRADVHTLFDLGLIRITPATRTVVLDESLKSSTYGELHGRRLTLPQNTEAMPSETNLQYRWDSVSRTMFEFSEELGE